MLHWRLIFVVKLLENKLLKYVVVCNQILSFCFFEIDLLEDSNLGSFKEVVAKKQAFF